ncbi:MAG: polynucleotide adenylyltransferase PcnB, partial [Paucibacter sp.]|nr:polynucleotide adenylyltransferase PcnB [Roseateles sp.]
ALLANVPISRMFDEMIKLLQTGHSLASLQELKKQGLGRGVFSILDAVLDDKGELVDDAQGEFVRRALEDTDRRVADGRSVAPSFMLACMLWDEVQKRWLSLREAGEPTVPALQQAIDQVFDARIGDISGRGKLAADMREIWMMQPRFERRSGSGPFSLVEQARYRAGFDFLILRAEVGEVSGNLVDWWEDFALGDDDERRALIDEAREEDRQRRGPKVHQVARGSVSGQGGHAKAQPRSKAEAEEGGSVDGSSNGPAKRRRRRRKPAGKGEAGAAPGAGDAGAGE